MREGFRKNLEEYGAIAKKQLALEPGANDQPLIRELFDSADEKARDRETSFGTQLDVAGLQKQKQEVMVWLKTELKKIESKKPLTEEEIEPKKRWVVFHDEMLFLAIG